MRDGPKPQSGVNSTDGLPPGHCPWLATNSIRGELLAAHQGGLLRLQHDVMLSRLASRD